MPENDRVYNHLMSSLSPSEAARVRIVSIERLHNPALKEVSRTGGCNPGLAASCLRSLRRLLAPGAMAAHSSCVRALVCGKLYELKLKLLRQREANRKQAVSGVGLDL